MDKEPNVDLEKTDKKEEIYQDVWKNDKRFKVVTEKIKFGDPYQHEKWLKKNKIDYVIKQSSESTHFIYELYSVRFIHSNRFPAKFLYLFGLVKKDVLVYLEKMGSIFLPPKNNPIKYNYDYEESDVDIVGTDINHAYWRIAYQKGFISKNTYEKGLECPSKALLQATLSVLGRKKHYTSYKDGKAQERVCADVGDPKLREVYQYIRLSCYHLMNDMSELLGEDFDCYKTDAIYYRGTDKNVKMVQDYLDQRGFSYKQLDYFEDENDVEEPIDTSN